MTGGTEDAFITLIIILYSIISLSHEILTIWKSRDENNNNKNNNSTFKTKTNKNSLPVTPMMPFKNKKEQEKKKLKTKKTNNFCNTQTSSGTLYSSPSSNDVIDEASALTEKPQVSSKTREEKTQRKPLLTESFHVGIFHHCLTNFLFCFACISQLYSTWKEKEK